MIKKSTIIFSVIKEKPENGQIGGKDASTNWERSGDCCGLLTSLKMTENQVSGSTLNFISCRVELRVKFEVPLDRVAAPPTSLSVHSSVDESCYAGWKLLIFFCLEPTDVLCLSPNHSTISAAPFSPIYLFILLSNL